MRPLHKVALVASGYVACLLLASVAVAIRIAITSDSVGQAAGGMYAFGDIIFFVAIFGVSALVPTGVALFFLRPNRPFWTVLSASGLAVACTGIAAAILYAIGGSGSNSRLATWAELSVVRILGSPLLVLAFLGCAVLSPHRSPRLMFLTAAVMEMAVSAYGGAVWFVPMFLHNP